MREFPNVTACHALSPLSSLEREMLKCSRVATFQDLLAHIGEAELHATRKRDLMSAIRRVCEMARMSPAAFPVDVAAVRLQLAAIRPAAHGVSAKHFANMRSLIAAALQMAGVADDPGRGLALKDPDWGPLMRGVAKNKALANGLAAFGNFCVVRGISPCAVNDDTVAAFHEWVTHRTLHPRPRDIVRGVPVHWNRARAVAIGWPDVSLSPISFRPPSRHFKLEQFAEDFQRDVETYLEMRRSPDVFSEHAPVRPLAETTLRQQREHIRLAASILKTEGRQLKTLADIVSPESFRAVLRHYHNRAHSTPNAFAQAMGKTLIQVVKYSERVSDEDLSRLRRIVAKLPAVSFDLTEKNKRVLRQLESDHLRAKLIFLPEQLKARVEKDVASGRWPRLVEAQMGLAIDVLLAIPLRSQNLIELHWRENFIEPDGDKGALLLHIPAGRTKSKRVDIEAQLPPDVAERIRWYRRFLAGLGMNPNGHLFVTQRGIRKHQETLTHQICEAIATHVGIKMTPHQFRHFAATSYLERHPQDFETLRTLLGHAWSKTTRIYAGSSTRRASRAYSEFLCKQREALRLKRRNGRRRR